MEFSGKGYIMKGYHFFLEYSSNKDKRAGTVKNPGNHAENCIAIPLDEKGRPFYIPGKEITMDCYGAVYFRVNSDVCGTSCHIDYLRENCKRIPEKLARTIHPKLFTYLEYEP